MFVITRDVTAAKKVIATLLATALVMSAYGLHSSRAEAANLTDISDTLTDSSPGADSDHTIQFTLPSSLEIGEDIVIDFDQADGFDFTGLLAGDVSVSAPDTNFDAAVIDSVNDDVTLTRNTSAIATSTVVTIVIGDANKINNPTDPAGGNESYEITVTAGADDTGFTRVVILDTVLVTADIATTFDFTVTGLGSGVDVNGETTTITSSSTTIPFGTLTAGAPQVLAQDLQVQTNASNGFVVTVESDGQFRSSTGADIDNFIDAADTASPASWVSPSNSLLDEDTWGHWGITSEDNDTGISGDDGLLDGDEFAANEFIAVTTSPRAIFAHDGPSDNSTPNVGSTTVGYKVEITALQEAGDDYQTTLTYIATPTF